MLNRLDGGAVRRLLSLYQHAYLVAARSVLRDDERAADEWSARVVGGPQAASSFPAVARIDAAWSILIQGYLPIAGARGVKADLRLGLLALLEAREAELDAYVLDQLDRRPSRLDTHPRDRERMDRLASLPALEGGDMDGREPAWSLLGRGADDEAGAMAALRDLEASFLTADGPVETWEDIVARGLLADPAENAAVVLGHVGARWPDLSPTLRGVLPVLVRDGPELMGPLMRGDVPAAERDTVLTQIIDMAIVHTTMTALADQGRARFDLRWDGPAALLLVSGSGEASPWPDEARPGSTDVPGLLGVLQAAGVDLDRPLVEFARVPDGTVRSVPVAVWNLVALRGRGLPRIRIALHNVVFHDDGLLIDAALRAHVGLRRRYLARRGIGRSALRERSRRRVDALVEAVAGDPVAWCAGTDPPPAGSPTPLSPAPA